MDGMAGGWIGNIPHWHLQPPSPFPQLEFLDSSGTGSTSEPPKIPSANSKAVRTLGKGFP